MQVGASFPSAALKKQTKSGFYTQLHIGSAATEPLSEMSSSSCMHGSVCPQLPRWRASATKPVWRWLYPPSTAMLTAHLTSPPEGITESRKDQLMLLPSSAAGYKSICLQEGLFLWPSLSTKCKMQPCYFPRQTQGRKHPLAAPVSSPHALSSRDSLLLSHTLLQMGQEPVSTLPGLVNFMFVIPGGWKESNSLVCEKPRVGSAKQRTGKLLWAALDPSGWAQIIPLQSHKAASVGESHHSNDSLR